MTTATLPGAAHRRSLQRTLTIGVVVALTLLSAGVGALLYGYARHTVLRQFDDSLKLRAQALATLVQHEGNGRYEFDFADEFMPEFDSGRRTADYFQIWLPDGSVLERSRSLGKANLPVLAGTTGRAVVHNITLPGSRRGRAAALRFVPQPDVDKRDDAGSTVSMAATGAAVVVLARDRRGIDSTLAALAVFIIAWISLTAVGAAGVVSLVVRRGLSPVRDLAARVAEIGPGTLERRFDARHAPTELQPIQNGLNALLERIQGAFQRERRFTSDVSHELRTPLAEARNCLEVALKWPEDTHLLASACGEALGAVRQMESLVATLLAVARSGSGSSPHPPQPVELVAVLQDALTGRRQRAENRGISVRFDRPGQPVRVHSDPVLMRAVIGNLVNNALEHAPAGSVVDISLSAGPDAGAALLVSNPAPDLSPQDLDRMFEAFWRKDESRSDSENHCGLGLSLVAGACGVLGCAIRARLDGGNLHMRLDIPA